MLAGDYTLALANPSLRTERDGNAAYTGFGGNPGAIMMIALPSDYNLPRLAAMGVERVAVGELQALVDLVGLLLRERRTGAALQVPAVPHPVRRDEDERENEEQDTERRGHPGRCAGHV